MTKSQPNYYAILPAAVRYDKELMDKAKLFYAEMSALSNLEGYCFAGNKYFADLYGISKQQVITIINNLEEKGYISVEREGNRRKIFICAAAHVGYADTVKKTLPQGKENFTEQGKENFTEQGKENFTHNNTSNNNINNNIYNKPYTPEFEKWYARYPKKFNKRQTYKNWCNALKEHTVKELYQALLAYERYIEQNNVKPEYITRSTNFLGRKSEFVGWLEADAEIQPTFEPEHNKEFEERARRFSA